jgi:hypothetical protein
MRGPAIGSNSLPEHLPAELFLKQNVRLFMSHIGKDKPEIVSTTEARSGVTGHNVRYVLAFGLAAVIIAFVLLFVAFP